MSETMWYETIPWIKRGVDLIKSIPIGGDKGENSPPPTPSDENYQEVIPPSSWGTGASIDRFDGVDPSSVMSPSYDELVEPSLIDKAFTFYDDTLRSASEFGMRMSNMYDYAMGDYQVPEAEFKPSTYFPSHYNMDNVLSTARGIATAAPGFSASLLRPAIATHLIADIMSGNFDLRRKGRSAGDGLIAMIEPYLVMATLGATSYTAEVLEDLAKGD